MLLSRVYVMTFEVCQQYFVYVYIRIDLCPVFM